MRYFRNIFQFRLSFAEVIYQLVGSFARFQTMGMVWCWCLDSFSVIRSANVSVITVATSISFAKRKRTYFSCIISERAALFCSVDWFNCTKTDKHGLYAFIHRRSTAHILTWLKCLLDQNSTTYVCQQIGNRKFLCRFRCIQQSVSTQPLPCADENVHTSHSHSIVYCRL